MNALMLQNSTARHIVSSGIAAVATLVVIAVVSVMVGYQ